MTKNKQIRNLRKLVKALMACESAEELAAALAMLPDYRKDGIKIVTAAAARIIAENYKEEEETDIIRQFEALEKEIRKNIHKP